MSPYEILCRVAAETPAYRRKFQAIVLTRAGFPLPADNALVTMASLWGVLAFHGKTDSIQLQDLER